MEFPQINLSSDLSSEKINISNFYEVQTKKALDLFFSLGDSLDNNLIFIKSQNPSIDFKDYVTSIKRISSNSLDEFKSNISSIYFFGSIQQSKNEYDLCEIINGIAMGESDIDINIELNSDYFENNKLLLKQLKKEMDIYFSLLFSREYDINFSPTLKNSNQYIFFSKPYQSYAEKIIRYTIETGSKLYERPLVLDKNNLEQSFSIFKGNQNNSVSGDLKQIYELSSLSILSKSRVEKLYKYSASAINYRLNFLFDSKTNFEWILPNDLNEKEMRFEIFLNALRFLIIDNENYLNSFFKFESQTELNMLYENINAIQGAINFCRKIGAELILGGLLTHPSFSKYLVNFNNFHNLYMDEFIDVGDDDLHPGIKMHAKYADSFTGIIKQNKYAQADSTLV